MLHYLFKIVLFQLNSTTMRNSVVLVELWKANFFFCQRNTRENKLKTYKSISDGPSVYIITLTLNFDIYLRAENTSFYMFVITVLQNKKGNNFFYVNPSVNIITSSLSSFLQIFFYKLNIPRDHHSLELLLYKGIKLNNLFIHLIMNYSN